MLTSVQLQEFRCLRAVSVPLKPLTVLIGENDTGKSTFLEALKRLVPNGTLRAQDGWRQTKEPKIVARSNDPRTVFVRSRDGQQPGGALRVGSFRLPADGPPMVSHGTTGGVPDLEPNGGGVPTLIDWFLRKDRERLKRFTQAIVDAVPGVTDIGIETPDAARRSIELKVDEGAWLPADQASAGVRLLLFFLALAHHPHPPALVLLEEPENGLHPRRMAHVMRLLRGLTEGHFGASAVQVVLSTHSPHLLDEVDPAKDQVLVFRRKEDGSRTAEPADAERLATFLDEFKLGEVWFNQHESGLVRRAPTP